MGKWKVKTISGSAGGITGEAIVNLKIETTADTVEEIRLKVEAVPQLLEALQMMVMDLEHTGEIFGTDEKRIEFMSDVITRATGE